MTIFFKVILRYELLKVDVQSCLPYLMSTHADFLKHMGNHTVIQIVRLTG